MKKSSLNKNKTDNVASRYPSVEKNSMILLLFFMFISIQTQAQKEDYNWIFGDFDDSRNLFSWDEDLNLSKDTAISDMSFFATNSSISDSLGSLLFYTNGLRIYDNSSHQTIINGDSLNYTDWYWNYANINFGHYRQIQSTLLLNSLENNQEYTLFSLRVDTLIRDSLDIFAKMAGSLVKTKIQKNIDNSYEVVSKNQIVFEDTLIMGNLTSCRHANGRDWWIVCQEALTNCVNVLLYTSDTLYLHTKKCVGVSYINYDIGVATFSSDGSKLIIGSGYNGLKIFDFDRCSGQLALKEYISRDDLMSPNDPIAYYFGYHAISPSSRYLYTGPSDSTFRFDLNSSNILSSKTLIAWGHPDSTNVYGFDPLHINEDGKIYAPAGNYKNYSVMNNPEDCNNVAECDIDYFVPLPKNGSQSFGNFPNYRLGRLIGSPCDTLYNSVSELDALDVLAAFPNPANDNIRIEYAGKFWEQVNNLHLKISNVLGQEYLYKKLPEYSAWQNINLTNYPKGIYFVYLMDQGKVLGTIRFVKR